MFGKRRDDGGARVTPEAPATPASDGPRMYRADSAMAPAPRAPAPAEPARRAPDVTATTGRRPDIRPSAPGDNEGKKLIVGREIALSGEIRACDLLVVEGRVEAVLSDSRAIEVSATGVFKGKAQIESAEISGVFEGELVTSDKLIIHSTGRVYGNIRYGQIEIARGGIIAGQIDVLTTGAAMESGMTAHGAVDGETADMLPDSPESHNG
ncbi:MAG TPA: polymer-forming cytoskeletal protein [Verrucomicrobiae bacterium]|jgi:cytoskeletal protein CcmA (bactofilin family)|nr:polymer-forming cytoskeletal protein [Verrucomicrobiae bacterium]